MIKLNLDEPELRSIAALTLRLVRQQSIWPRRDWSVAQETLGRARNTINHYLAHNGYQRGLSLVAREMNRIIALEFRRRRLGQVPRDIWGTDIDTAERLNRRFFKAIADGTGIFSDQRKQH